MTLSLLLPVSICGIFALRTAMNIPYPSKSTGCYDKSFDVNMPVRFRWNTTIDWIANEHSYHGNSCLHVVHTREFYPLTFLHSSTLAVPFLQIFTVMVQTFTVPDISLLQHVVKLPVNNYFDTVVQWAVALINLVRISGGFVTILQSQFVEAEQKSALQIWLQLTWW